MPSACDLTGRPYPYCPGHISMVNIETPLPTWSCHTGTRAMLTFMACLKIVRVILNVHIVPPNPRGGDNTEKYCPRPFGPRAIFFRIITSSWIRGHNMDTVLPRPDPPRPVKYHCCPAPPRPVEGQNCGAFVGQNENHTLNFINGDND